MHWLGRSEYWPSGIEGLIQAELEADNFMSDESAAVGVIVFTAIERRNILGEPPSIVFHTLDFQVSSEIHRFHQVLLYKVQLI
ncbi:hypothetical protein D3C80_1643460 [compost metagenome]